MLVPWRVVFQSSFLRGANGLNFEDLLRPPVVEGGDLTGEMVNSKKKRFRGNVRYGQRVSCWVLIGVGVDLGPI